MKTDQFTFLPDQKKYFPNWDSVKFPQMVIDYAWDSPDSVFVEYIALPALESIYFEGSMMEVYKEVLSLCKERVRQYEFMQENWALDLSFLKRKEVV